MSNLLRWIVKPPYPIETYKKIYILDSSFNPPTIAHLKMIETIPLNPCEHELKMLMLSTNNVDKPQSDLESRIKLISKLGYPFAIVQAAKFVDKQKLFDTETVFIMGYDTIVRFFDHKYYSDFTKELDNFFMNAKIAMFHRDSNELIIDQKYKDRIDIYQDLNFGYPVSSTIVRNILKDPNQRNEQFLKKYIPLPVLAEILELGLYKNER